MANKLYGEEDTFRPFTLTWAVDGRFCRFEPTPMSDFVFIRFRDASGLIREETLDTQEAINQIALMILQGYEESYDSDSGGPTRDLLEVAAEMQLTSPSTYLN